MGKWVVIAGPPSIEIGSVYYNKNGGIEGTKNDYRIKSLDCS